MLIEREKSKQLSLILAICKMALELENAHAQINISSLLILNRKNILKFEHQSQVIINGIDSLRL